MNESQSSIVISQEQYNEMKEALATMRDVANMQPERDTENRKDKWMIVAYRILHHVDREDVADALDEYVGRLESKSLNK